MELSRVYSDGRSEKRNFPLDEETEKKIASLTTKGFSFTVEKLSFGGLLLKCLNKGNKFDAIILPKNSSLIPDIIRMTDKGLTYLSGIKRNNERTRKQKKEEQEK